MKRRALMLTGGAAVALAAPAFAQEAPKVLWRMPSSFPKSLDTVYGGATAIASIVSEMTNGRFEIRPSGAGELVPPLSILDAVQANTVECGHTAGFYYVGKEPALVFDTGVPFGMTPRQHMAWMQEGGGMALMNEVYGRFGVVQMPCGNTGAQMGGWFRKEIKTPKDFDGLRMRVPGLLGKVYAKLGALPQQLAGSDVYPSLEKGVLDAAEFVGPYDDEKLGLSKVARYYYAPGVMELGASLCFIANRSAWESLPANYKAALQAACAQANIGMLAKYDARNIAALKRIVGAGAKLSFWPKPVMDAMLRATQEVLKEESAANPVFAKVHGQWRAFLDDMQFWASINDGAAEQYLLTVRRKS
ncbi:MAG: ABC transporter substrate-binding protein [Gammaproteobacteria bacterium]|nr:ABC transporter substrate-binding protein [Gammaproteobacteria bacterium]MBU1439763.1 ABC transporter substrate-binding protein [Gammaproteobacteria bacterium]MBU2408631.1 ABC transporter substrate-binding protein [Gammaproteobacteria bacterium]